MSIAARVRDATTRHYTAGDVEVRAALTVGVAVSGPDSSTHELIERADLAMLEAKRRGDQLALAP